MRNTHKRSRLEKTVSKTLSSIEVATWVKQLKTQWEEDVFYTRTVTEFCYLAWVRVEKILHPIRRHLAYRQAGAANFSLLSFVAVAGTYILFPTIANADIELGSLSLDTQTIELIIDSMQNETISYGTLPVAQDADPRDTFTIPITAYTSDSAQTDGTPCITASGLDVCEHGQENVVAANFLPLGTRVRIPELYGDRVFTVEDRMNERYYYKMDIWMEELEDAKLFGVQYATVEVF